MYQETPSFSHRTLVCDVHVLAALLHWRTFYMVYSFLITSEFSAFIVLCQSFNIPFNVHLCAN